MRFGYLLLASLLVFSCNKVRKNFKATFQDGVFNEPNCVLQLTDGSYLLAGYNIEKDDPNQPEMPYRIMLVKTDASGNLDWQKTLALTEYDEAIAALAEKDGIVITGQTASGEGDMDMLLAKINEKGDTLWVKAIGSQLDERGNAIITAHGGGYLIAGASGVFDMFDPNLPKQLLIAKTDVKGNAVWAKTYPSSQHVEAKDVKLTGNGYIVAANASDTSSKLSSIMLLHLNQQGDTLWTQAIGDSSHHFYANSIEASTDGGYVVAGLKRPLGGNTQGIVLIKVNAQGRIQWQKDYSGRLPQEIGGMSLLQNEGYILAGSIFNPENSGNNIYLIKTNEQGDTLWTHTYASENSETVRDILVAKDQGICIVGAHEVQNQSSIFFLKVDEKGMLME
ncbi:MAG: hypothetical protein SFW35_06180 [Chitinophagales bacterium]|nr:hypothetical protein [Chitinophagales bacterium]